MLAVYLLARRWLPGWPGLVAAALVALNPYLIFFSGLVLTETLFTTMLCWGMVLLVLSGGPWPIRRSRLIAWLGGGLLLALSVLVRPGAAGLPVLLGIAAAIANRNAPTPRRARWPLPVIATMLVLTGIVLFPWASRNRWVLKSWIWTTTNTGITYYDGFNPDATGASNQKFVSWIPWTREMTEVGRSRYFTELADEWIAQHPAAAGRLAAVKIARTWSPIPLSDEYGSRALYGIVGLTYGVVLDVLILAGLRWGPCPRSVKGLLLMPALYFTVGAALSVGSLRYRVPAEAPMAILAASTLAPRRKSVMTQFE